MAEIMYQCQQFPTFDETNLKFKQGFVVALEEVLKDVSKETKQND